MTTYESKIQTVARPQSECYEQLADLRNIAQHKERLPTDFVEKMTVDADTCSFPAPQIGQVTLRIVEREPEKTIKFDSPGLPIAFNLWIQLLPSDEGGTHMKVTIKADIPMMLRPMIGDKMQEVPEKIAKALASVLEGNPTEKA